ncbi:MAG: hypothetical protein QM582_15435 [Micropruina sp.]|uniref:hypothetical protein n=1 Tax=Micropruina sp. TaxID=2737536 RepID=UPI0039E237C5
MKIKGTLADEQRWSLASTATTLYDNAVSTLTTPATAPGDLQVAIERVLAAASRAAESGTTADFESAAATAAAAMDAACAANAEDETQEALKILYTQAVTKAATQDDLENVRKQAAGWSTTVTAALGVFSVSGLVLGKDVVNTVVADRMPLFVLLAVVAAACAVAAILSSSMATHGWPGHPREPSDLAGQLQAIKGAVFWMRFSVWVSGAAVLLLMMALGTAWLP